MQLQQKICVDVVFRHACMWLNSATVPLKYVLCIHIFNMGHQIHARKSITDYPELVKLVSPAFNVMAQWCFLCILPSSSFTISPPSWCYMYTMKPLSIVSEGTVKSKQMRENNSCRKVIIWAMYGDHTKWTILAWKQHVGTMDKGFSVTYTGERVLFKELRTHCQVKFCFEALLSYWTKKKKHIPVNRFCLSYIRGVCIHEGVSLTRFKICNVICMPSQRWRHTRV
jgi:hypothetical protein